MVMNIAVGNLPLSFFKKLGSLRTELFCFLMILKLFGFLIFGLTISAYADTSNQIENSNTKLMETTFTSNIAVTVSNNLYPIGESFVFKAKILGVPIGTVSMAISNGVYNEIPSINFLGRCYGYYVVYEADVRLSSHISAVDDLCLYHEIEQYGSERRGRHLLFNHQSNLVDYIRLDKDEVYRWRTNTVISSEVYDVFSCAFQARRDLNVNIGGVTDIKMIEKDEVYHIRCTAVEEKVLSFDVGKFNAVKLKFEAIDLPKEKVFKGVLDLDKDIELWVEKKSKTPLMFVSTVPFGFVRPKVYLKIQNWNMIEGFKPDMSLNQRKK